MKKMTKILEKIIVIFIVILLALIAFWGVFVKDKGIWSNVIPEYKYGMDIAGTRELRYTIDKTEEEKKVYVDENGNVISEVWKDGTAVTDEEDTEEETVTTEETTETVETNEETESSEESTSKYTQESRTIKANEDNDLTKENFEKTKKIIIERFKKQEIEAYNIRLDDVTGELVIEAPNNDDDVSKIENCVQQIGKFQIVDYQNGELLMDNSDIKNVSVTASNNESYKAYLQIEFNKEGSQKLKDISNKYIEVKNETNEDSESEEDSDDEESTIYKVVLQLDGTKMMTTYFGEEMSNGILQLSIGSETTDYNEFKESYEYAETIADVLNTGVLPIDYELESDDYIKNSSMNFTEKMIVIIALAVVILIIAIVLIIKFKLNGLFVSISSVGFISMISIVSRYTNVLITMNSLITYGLIIVLNYVFLISLLKNINTENSFWTCMKKFYLNIIPVIAFVIVFIFTKYSILNSIGMVAFWGIIWIALYNIVFTKLLLKK